MSTTTDTPTPALTGTSASTDELLHDIAEEAPLRDPVRRRRLLLGLGIAVIVLALVFVMLRVFGGDSQKDKDAAALGKVQEQILPELQTFLPQREAFFAAERVYLPAMEQAAAAARVHNRAPRRAAPDLSAQIAELQQVSKEMTALATKLRDAPPAPGVTSDAHDYLLSATRVLNRDARRNAAALENVRGRITLVAVDNENALNPIRRMNKSLLFVLDAAQLPVQDFDLPGGTDPHPEDHSTTM